MRPVKLKDTQTGEVLERMPLDAKEIIASNGGRYVRLEDYKQNEAETAPAAEVKPQETGRRKV